MYQLHGPLFANKLYSEQAQHAAGPRNGYLQRVDASAAAFPHCNACVSASVLAALSAATPPWAFCELATTLCSICLSDTT